MWKRSQRVITASPTEHLSVFKEDFKRKILFLHVSVPTVHLSFGKCCVKIIIGEYFYTKMFLFSHDSS